MTRLSFFRQRKYAIFAAIRRNMNFYNCSEEDALGYVPPEWVVYRDRHGHGCPSEERSNRLMGGEEWWC